jgi:hypothetical protein
MSSKFLHIFLAVTHAVCPYGDLLQQLHLLPAPDLLLTEKFDALLLPT